MVNRVIDVGLWVVMALLGIGVGVGALFTRWAAALDKPILVLAGARTILLELGTLVVVVAVFSIRKRLAAIEAKLSEH